MNNIEPADKPAVALPFSNRRKSEIPLPKPLPVAHILPTKLRNELVAFLGEFVGTLLFLFFAFAGTQVANMVAAANPISGPYNASVLLYIALSFGFSLSVTVWVFFRISGGLFNPAVSLMNCTR
jgi:aquaporin related protein